MWQDFKKFISRGNVIDMAVGVIIGGAFGKIVSSLVNDIIMPLIGVILGGINFSALKTPPIPSLNGAEPVSICYGMFLQQIVDFLIIATSVFLMIKLIEKFKKKKPEPAKAAPSTQECLLMEIRDLLKK